MSANGGCLLIAVDETEVRDSTSIPGIIAGGILGCIVGIVVGILLFKFCYNRRGCFNRSGAVAVQNSEKTRPVQTYLTYEDAKIYDSPVPMRHQFEHADGTVNEYNENDKKELLMLSDFLNSMTWDGMMVQLGKHRLCDLISFEQSLWEERHRCLIQEFRCVLNKLLAQEIISDVQHHDVLSQEEKMLARSLESMKKNWNEFTTQIMDPKRRNLSDLFKYFQESHSEDTKSMITVYRERANHFVKALTEIIGREDVAVSYYTTILEHLDAVEGFYRKSQDELIDSSNQLYKRFELMLKELGVILITEKQMGDILSVRCNTSLDKLVKTGRISSRTVQTVKDSFQVDCHITKEDLLHAFGEINYDIIQSYRATLHKHKEETNDTLHSVLLGYEKQTSSDGFVQQYLSACHQEKIGKISILNDFANSEYSVFTFNLSKLLKGQREKRMDAIQDFCKHLEEIDALSNSELDILRNDFMKKLDADHSKISAICKRNTAELWRIYETKIAAYMEEGNGVDASILQNSVSDDIVSLESLMHIQINLSEEDCLNVMHERESLILLLCNEINILRGQWLHIIENGMNKCQAFLMFEKSEDLATNTVAEVRSMLDSLWNEQNTIRNLGQQGIIYSMKAVLAISYHEMCKVISIKLIKNLLNEHDLTKYEELIHENVEKSVVQEISKKNALTNFAAFTQDHNERFARQMKEHIDRHSSAMSAIEENVKAAQLKRQGRINIKVQRIEDYRPPSGSNPNDVKQYLERIILQNQARRAVDGVDRESVRQVMLQRLNLDKSVTAEISRTLKDSVISLLAKLAIVAGIEKSEYMSRVDQAKSSSPIRSARRRNNALKFNKVWKDALSQVEKASN